MTQTTQTARKARFAVGAILAAACLACLAEGFLRLFPPRDLHPYLGDASPLRGIHRADPDLAVTYRDWDAFSADNAAALAPHLPLTGHSDARPVWAMFGNSFVQAPGMLADTARARLPDRRIFNLGRNELLPLRFAQARLLLDRGLAPERLFFNLMPVDAIQLARQPLDTYRVNARGAITYDVPAGGPTGWLARHTRLGLTAWARTRRDASRDGTVSQKLHDRVDPELLADLKRLFVALAADARRHRVPVTVMLLPTHQQVTKGASFAFQDALGACLRQAGLDVFDPRQAFCDHPDRAGLFLPDKHFNEAGNAVLLAELLRHLGRGGPVATRVP